MYQHITQARVRYGETDQMGFLYYGNYALYYEIGRTETIRSIGITYRQMEQYGIMLPVVSMESQYLRPATYDDLITIKTRIEEFPHGSHITFISELYNEASKLLNIGKVTLVFYDMNEKKKTTAPDYILQALKPYFS